MQQRGIVTNCRVIHALRQILRGPILEDAAEWGFTRPFPDMAGVS
jgi:hypothetical protein